MRKYRNIKTYVGDELLDSKKEARCYSTLMLLQRAGAIRDLQRQVPFVLLDAYTNNKGEKIREIKYLADFVYYDIQKSQWTVVDVKSAATRTQVYKLKKKLFEYKYRDYVFEEM